MATTAQPADVGEFYEVDAVAAALKVSRQTVYRLIHSGDLKAAKVGNQFRVHRDVLRAYLGLDETGTTAPQSAVVAAA